MNDIVTLAKRLSFPKGSRLEDASVVWSRTGGRDGAMTVQRVVDRVTDLKWVREKSSDGTLSLVGPKGHMLIAKSSQGSTANTNTYELMLVAPDVVLRPEGRDMDKKLSLKKLLCMNEGSHFKMTDPATFIEKMDDVQEAIGTIAMAVAYKLRKLVEHEFTEDREDVAAPEFLDEMDMAPRIDYAIRAALGGEIEGIMEEASDYYGSGA